MRKTLAALCLFAFIQATTASTLPADLTGAEIDQIVRYMGHGSVTKLLRSADPLRELWPGVKVSAEVNVILSGDLEQFGNGTGDVPGVVPMPRLHIAKSLPLDLELILSLIPSSITHTIASTGFILKWCFYNERNKYLSGAAFVGYTGFTGFSGMLDGSSYEAGVYFSKDLVKMRPYVGLATLFTHGSVPTSLARSEKFDTWQATLHAFVGAEFALLPIDIAVQVDFFNLQPRGSLSFGKIF